MAAKEEKPAILGGPPAVTIEEPEANLWPIITDEEIKTVTDLLGKGDISVSDEPMKLESEFAEYIGSSHALAHTNGTAALHAACFAAEVGPGDEVLIATYNYWAPATAVTSANGIPVFCDIDPDTLAIDPEDMATRITPRTKAVIVTHVWGLPADMDRIMTLAREHGLVVIEDASHAHGAEYKGVKIGAMGHIGCFSLQASKLMVAGEGGLLVTDDDEYYERAVVLGHYRRIPDLSEKYNRYGLAPYGWKYRIMPLAAAIARSQLRKLDERNDARARNLERLQSRIEGLPGIKVFNAPEKVKRTYYGYLFRYEAEELGGLPMTRFLEALRAEGVEGQGNRYDALLHQQPLFQERDIYGRGCPWSCPYADRRISYDMDDLPVARRIVPTLIDLPTFPNASVDLIDQVAAAITKVTANAGVLME
jgi:dTDP-4-amino-4,6-dideoxygalactose transaminase